MYNNSVWRLAILIISVAFFSSTCYSEEGFFKKQRRLLNISPYVGYHFPDLKDLSEGLFNSPLIVKANLTNELFIDTTRDFIFHNDLPSLGPGAELGLEFEVRLSKKSSLIFGGSTWESTSESSIRTEFPLQRVLNSVVSEREISISYTQFFLGWKKTWFERPQKFRFYGSFALHEFFDVDLRERFSFLFLEGAAEGFPRILILQAQNTGIALFSVGVGGEYFITKRLSIGLDGSYYFGVRDFPLQVSENPLDNFRDDCSDGGPGCISDSQEVEEILPTIDVDNSGEIRYRTPDGEGFRKLELGFDGWRAAIRLTLHF